MVEKAAAPWERVQKILNLGSMNCDEQLYGRVHAFFKGYVRYHLSCARYEIAGLCAEAGNEELHRFYQMSVVAKNGEASEFYVANTEAVVAGLRGDATIDVAGRTALPSLPDASCSLLPRQLASD
ncbi:hypothetical protein ASPVEDRAFT_86540 [Aspergillus versicolor CBS 583.65]|uniref:Uncharacterized protein n=1 Tax=Aspergillus versicolor CBS 583.65 TaxID=1036611 RepID=A0A1L9PUR4_ASPVE|nr:uncharacterized protein ASPVEDRAFT_86540 [Aspergillus versicolor CBS 583.65]OJJ05175.1 hypothetical protein ASPVEDRAFT_86540 [Aspergillus versicolor CBS 583.65]